jgi:cytochrome c oxidase assembly protein subunit 15
MTEVRYHPALHRIALLTAAATFPLIFMGGLVTSHGAGMSVPDWPNTYGYNMFLFPPRLWVGGILYEHTHRLMGTVVGLLSILLTIWAWKTESRKWVRWLATGVLGAVIFQGVLGGLRVVMVQLDLAIIHACFAQAFFCLAAFTAIVTSQWWINAPDLSREESENTGRRLVILAAACVFAIYAQLIVGAMMRHYDAGLAIPDLPLAYGKLIPPTTEEDLAKANTVRAWESGLKPVTFLQVWLHFGHRIGAVIVSGLVVALVATVIRRFGQHRRLRRPAWTLSILLLTQLTLGVCTVLYRKPADVASAHVAVGALTLVTTFVLFARSARLYLPRTRQRGFDPVTNHDRLTVQPTM